MSDAHRRVEGFRTAFTTVLFLSLVLVGIGPGRCENLCLPCHYSGDMYKEPGTLQSIEALRSTKWSSCPVLIRVGEAHRAVEKEIVRFYRDLERFDLATFLPDEMRTNPDEFAVPYLMSRDLPIENTPQVQSAIDATRTRLRDLYHVILKGKADQERRFTVIFIYISSILGGLVLAAIYRFLLKG